ncbi:serine protease grass-like [Drosophila subpulchrella]|uniref:serine protease grass-like n=1 Tax=Drosophila subpulchrella TaxID=1486046 RepID=UPI0018A15FD5|nr:serine protease grass-like [Drosophila subpulchrella]
MQRFKGVFAVLACLFLGTENGSAFLLERECGKSNRSENYGLIGGGQYAGILSNPWMVLIIVRGSPVCGGSLITSGFVLTAAHCISPFYTTVRLGDYLTVDSEDDCSRGVCIPRAYIKNVDMKLTHANFGTAPYSRYDIGLLRMADVVMFSDYVRPICLLLNAKMEDVLQFNVTGWGRREDGDMSRVLQKATLSRINSSYCESHFNTKTDQTQICTDSYSSETCDGDSGGPLSAEVLYEGQLRPFLYGVVSSGSQNCTTGGVDVHTNVEKFMDWIVSAVNRYSYN